MSPLVVCSKLVRVIPRNMNLMYRIVLRDSLRLVMGSVSLGRRILAKDGDSIELVLLGSGVLVDSSSSGLAWTSETSTTSEESSDVVALEPFRFFLVLPSFFFFAMVFRKVSAGKVREELLVSAAGCQGSTRCACV